MEQTTKNNLIQKYKSGILTDEENKQIEDAILQGIIKLEELEHASWFDQMIVQPKDVNTPAKMDARFYAWLEATKKVEQRSKVRRRWLWQVGRVAAAMLLLIMVFFAGRYYDSSTNGGNPTQDLAVDLLTSNDVSNKIHMISTADLSDQANHKVVEALLFTLNNDESNNVRLACIEALIDYADQPKVREGLIQSIKYQTAPVVLSNLAEAIQLSGERISPNDFEMLLDKDLPQPLINALKTNVDKI